MWTRTTNDPKSKKNVLSKNKSGNKFLDFVINKNALLSVVNENVQKRRRLTNLFRIFPTCILKIPKIGKIKKIFGGPIFS